MTNHGATAESVSQAVYAYWLIGYENRDIADREFSNDDVDAGAVGFGNPFTALDALTLADGYRQAGALATVRLRAKPPGLDVLAEEWDTVFPCAAVQRTVASVSADVRLALGSTLFAERLRASLHVAELSNAAIEGLIHGTSGGEERRP